MYLFRIQGKKVTCKKAEARQGKIYVGKLPEGEAMSKEDLEAHFGQFGEVVEVVMEEAVEVVDLDTMDKLEWDTSSHACLSRFKRR